MRPDTEANTQELFDDSDSLKMVHFQKSTSRHTSTRDGSEMPPHFQKRNVHSRHNVSKDSVTPFLCSEDKNGNVKYPEWLQGCRASTKSTLSASTGEVRRPMRSGGARDYRQSSKEDGQRKSQLEAAHRPPMPWLEPPASPASSEAVKRPPMPWLEPPPSPASSEANCQWQQNLAATEPVGNQSNHKVPFGFVLGCQFQMVKDVPPLHNMMLPGRAGVVAREHVADLLRSSQPDFYEDTAAAK
jgi:hypothetical protein